MPAITRTELAAETAEAIDDVSDTSAILNGRDILTGFFGDPYADVLGVGTTEPTFTVSISATVSAGDDLEISGQRYLVRAAEDDGMGASVLRLQKVN